MTKESVSTDLNKSGPNKPEPKRNIIGRIIIAIVASIFLLAFISLIYFLTLISVEYKSFPLVTQKIEEKVNQNLSYGLFLTIGKSEIKFEDFHKIRVKIEDMKLTSADESESLLPKVELEFSIFKLALLKTIPSKIKIIGPTIDIDQTSGKARIAVNGIDNEDVAEQQKFLETLSQTFLSLDSGSMFVSKFSIIDATINFRNDIKSQTIILKDSRIHTSFSGGSLKLESQNTITLDPAFPDLIITTDCNFKKVDGLKCDIDFMNFMPRQIMFFDPRLEVLNKVEGSFNGQINLAINSDYQLSNIGGNILASSGSFKFTEYFKEAISFQNLKASVKLDNIAKTIILDNLSCNFGNTKFAMSLSASDFMDPALQKTIMQFKVNDVATNKLDLFWPLFLNHNGVRKWVLTHIKDGTIKDAYATMIMAPVNGVSELQKIESEVAFSGLNLEYDPAFPPISNITGIASFNNRQMKIDISGGDVLKSKINFASVKIPDFAAKKTMLEINGKIFGAAEDSLKHIGYKTEFAKEIGEYFNGDAKTDLIIKLPLAPNLDLKHVYIKVASEIENFNNGYITNSKVNVSTLKEIGNNNFLTEIDLSSANVDLKQFDITKKSGVPSKIKTVLSFDNKNNLYLKKFEWNEENKSLTGNLSLNTDPLEITEINLKNNNFANSNFELIYKTSKNSRFVRLEGKRLDLRSILAAGNDGDNDPDPHYRKNDIQVDLEELRMANDQKFRNINIDIDCDLGVCEDGFILAKMNAKNNIDLRISKPGRKDPTRIKGTISDVSILVKALDLSNQMIDGNAVVKINMKENGKLDGRIDINDGFTILKNEVVEKISNNDAFADLKQKIKNSDKIVFDSLKIEFDYQNSVLDINTLIASSYLLGVTTKGRINIDIGKVELKGLIVPGYALNKLFGIGRIPVIGQIIVGEEGGGIFAIRYDYIKNPEDKKGNFTINPASAVIPGGIRNVFDLF